MPQTQDQVKTQETARRIIRIFADDPGLLLGAISPVASDRREADEELVPKIAAILDETREAGPDLQSTIDAMLKRAGEACEEAYDVEATQGWHYVVSLYDDLKRIARK